MPVKARKAAPANTVAKQVFMHFPRSVSALIGDSAYRVRRQARKQNTPLGSWREGVGGCAILLSSVIGWLGRATQYPLVGGHWMVKPGDDSIVVVVQSKFSDLRVH